MSATVTQNGTAPEQGETTLPPVTSTALARPRAPDDEFRLALEPSSFQQAGTIAGHILKSGMFKVKSLDDALIRIMTGRALGLPMFASLRGIYSVNGAVGLESKLKVALCLQRPDCEYFYCTERSATQSTWVAKRKGRPKEQSLTFTIAEAKMAGLLDYDTPEKKAAAAWTRFPADMLVARASGKLADLVWPEASYGLPSTDELEDMRAIDTTGETVAPVVDVPQAAPARDFSTEADALKQRIVDAKTPEARKAVRAEIAKFIEVCGEPYATEIGNFYNMTYGIPAKQATP